MTTLYQNFRESISARLRLHFRDKEQLEDIAYAMVQMLKLSLQQARDLARAGAAQRNQINKLPQLKNSSRALATLRSMNVPLELSEALRVLDAHAGNSYLLALPFSVSAMSLIAHLVRDPKRRFCIIDTRFTRYYFHQFLVAPETRERVQLILPAAMLRQNREATDNAVTYVTFPDLESTSLDTARRVRFLGEDYQFSTLEPLLFFRGLAPLFTFSAADFDATHKLKLVAYESPKVNAVTEADIDALLSWLAQHMDQVFRAAASDVLSWAETRMLAYSMKATTAVMKLKMVEGYVRAWKSADPNFNDARFARSIVELQKVQETVDKERLAATGV
jgi:hypothetical protein